MAMAVTVAPHHVRPNWVKSARPLQRGRSGLSLFFPRDARALRTPFRSYALHLLYWAAQAELGRSLRSATVSTWSEPGEADSQILLLSILADVDETEIERVRDVVLIAISEEAKGWSDDERQDYSRRVYFELEPLLE